MSLCVCAACANLGAFLDRASAVDLRALAASARTAQLSPYEASLERHHRLADRTNRPSVLTRASRDEH